MIMKNQPADMSQSGTEKYFEWSLGERSADATIQRLLIVIFLTRLNSILKDLLSTGVTLLNIFETNSNKSVALPK